MGGGKIDSSSAFLGPNLWNNPDNNDFNLEFMDLDEFLSETGIGVGENLTFNYDYFLCIVVRFCLPKLTLKISEEDSTLLMKVMLLGV